MPDTLKGIYRAFLIYGDRIKVIDHRYYHYENKLEFVILMFDEGKRKDKYETDHTRHEITLEPGGLTDHKSSFVENETWAHS